MPLKRLSLLATSLLLVACQPETGSQAQTEPETPPEREITWSDEVTQPATLIHHLPEDTVAYIRVPSVTALFAAPKNNGMGQFLESEANETALKQLFSGSRTELEGMGAAASIANLALERLRSPLEVAVSIPEGASFTAARVQATARLDFDSREALQERIAQWVATQPNVSLKRPLTENQSGMLSFGPMPAYYQYNPDNRRLALVAGFSATTDALSQIGQTANETHPALTRQAGMEASGYGLYTWVSAARLLPMARPFMNPNQWAELEQSGLDRTDEVALSLGTAQGRGRLSVYADGTGGPIWDLALPAAAPTAVTTHGRPDILSVISMPDYAWVETVVQLSGEDLSTWDAELADHDMTVRAIVEAVSGRLTTVYDELGTYSILEATKPDQLANLAAKLSASELLTVTEHDYNGTKLMRWRVPAEQWVPQQDPEVALWTRGQSIQTWVMREGDNWVFAGVPQVLMARADLGSDFDLQPWLAATGDAGHSMMVLSHSEDVVRKNYHYYLLGMQMLSDAVNADVNMMAFPPAHERAWPETSTVSAAVDYKDQAIRLELGYENHPIELVQASPMAGIAMVGILSAVAIPAYQDYVERAEAPPY
ncbi:hypothetical protein ACFOZ5_03580 [Marinobacter lacisalsi]|uniref:Lipoprotein n=1 Tax=Marinobacter lacisalsi TaxID=475979 RepID=A0ABV8QCM9_9GAMM